MTTAIIIAGDKVQTKKPTREGRGTLRGKVREMVRLYAITVYYKTEPSKALEKKAAYELSSFGFFNRSRSIHNNSGVLLLEGRAFLPV